VQVSVDGLFIVRAKEFLDVVMKSPVFNNTADQPQTEEEELQSLHDESFALNRSIRRSSRRASRAKPVTEVPFSLTAYPLLTAPRRAPQLVSSPQSFAVL
jgi:hypothetical protein